MLKRRRKSVISPPNPPHPASPHMCKMQHHINCINKPPGQNLVVAENVHTYMFGFRPGGKSFSLRAAILIAAWTLFCKNVYKKTCNDILVDNIDV